jgi:hypothetical protein
MYQTHADGIFYGNNIEQTNKLWWWVDVDFATDLGTRRSHTDYVLMLSGGSVTWKSTKQKSVSLSTAETEWYASSEAGKEIKYLNNILFDFGIDQDDHTKLYEEQ